MTMPADSINLTTQINPGALHSWMARRRFPSAFELTSENFQHVMNPNSSTLVILVAVEESEATTTEKLLSEIGTAWKAQPAFFVWINAEKWGSWLSHMYGFRRSKSPFVVIAKHKVGLPVFCLMACRLTFTQYCISDWLTTTCTNRIDHWP